MAKDFRHQWCERCCEMTKHYYNWLPDMRGWCCKQCGKPQEMGGQHGY